MVILFHCLDIDLSTPLLEYSRLVEGGRAGIRGYAEVSSSRHTLWQVLQFASTEGV